MTTYIYPTLDVDKKQSDINKILSKYEDKRSLFTSLTYLYIDILLNISCFYLFNFINSFCLLYKIPLYILYSIIQGTLLVSFWMIAHECGHGSFSKYQTINNIIGYILHECLLIPYFAWQYSHSKHHKYTNNLVIGESYVPQLKETKYSFKWLVNIFGNEGFTLFTCLYYILLGWPSYLFFNQSGGRVQSDLKTPIDYNKNASHYWPWSQIIPSNLEFYIALDTIGLISFICMIFYFNLFVYYIGPYLVVNAWLIIYTYLNHTHEKIPHYGIDQFNFLRGALSTCDRILPRFIDVLHHDFASTHVLHHINSRVPHYEAKVAFTEIYPIIKDNYISDDRNLIKTFYQTIKKCQYVESLEGVQFYKSYLTEN